MSIKTNKYTSCYPFKMNISDLVLDMDVDPPIQPPEINGYGDTVDQEILDSIWILGSMRGSKKRKATIVFTKCNKKLLGVTKKRKRKMHYTITEAGLQCSHGTLKRSCPVCLCRK